jgi:hypothetical protein
MKPEHPSDAAQSFSMEVAFDDEEGVISLEARTQAESWTGLATAYTTTDELRRFAAELSRFSRELSGKACFSVGSADDYNSISLRLFVYDLAKHVACEVELMSRVSGPVSKEGVFRIQVEFGTEPTFIENFHSDIINILNKKSKSNCATLRGL